jgi:DNA polymerase III subunit chi
MAEVWFYHLDRQPVEAVLPRILAGLMQRGDKVCVQFADATRVEEFSRVLWGYEDAAFIAHGIDGEDVTPHHTLCLTAQAGNPIAASIAAFVDGTMPDELDGLARAMVFLSASDDNALLLAPKREWPLGRSGSESGVNCLLHAKRENLAIAIWADCDTFVSGWGRSLWESRHVGHNRYSQTANGCRSRFG